MSRLRWSCAAVAVLAVSALAGKLLDVPLLAGATHGHVPLAPHTALALLFLAAALHPDLPWARSRRTRLALLVPVYLLAAASVLFALHVLQGGWAAISAAISVAGLAGHWERVWMMSPLTGGLFILLASSTAALVRRDPGTSSGPSAWSATFTLFFSSLVLIGYLFDAPLFYGGDVIPIAALTAVGFIILSSAIIVETGARLWPWSLLAGDSPRAMMLRAFLPLGFGIALCVSLIDMHGGMAGDTLASASILVWVLFTTAWLVIKISSRVDGRIEAIESRFRSLIENAPEAIFVIQMGGRFTYLNPAMLSLFRARDPSDLLGKDCFSIVAPESHAAVRERIRRQRETGKPVPLMEHTFLRLDGTPIPIETIAIPMAFEGQDSIVVFLRDITERKKSEAALANMQKLESLGTLAGGIAHDFNNILTAVVGNLSLLRSKTAADGEAGQLCREASDACETAKGLARQLLTFSKGGTPVVKTVDLNPLLKKTAAFAARGTNARCVFDLGESPLAVSVDVDQIAQVVSNLIINATQAMPLGGDITMRTQTVSLLGDEQPRLPAGRYVRVTVADQGAGIPSEHLPKIFDPYYSTKAASRGLGLATCYSIMAKHGGRISAESRPGAGTVFTLHFPAALSKDIRPEAEHPPITAGGGRILIMDDEAPVVAVMKRMLERLGYQAESAADGRTALAAYAQAREAGRPYDAVIMDLTVPGGMGGKETIGELRALDPGVKAIVSSGYSDDPIIAEFGKHGFQGALTKPYRLEEVSEVLRRIRESTHA